MHEAKRVPSVNPIGKVEVVEIDYVIAEVEICCVRACKFVSGVKIGAKSIGFDLIGNLAITAHKTQIDVGEIILGIAVSWPAFVSRS